MKPLFTKQYDLSGNSLFRVFKIALLNKIIPIGNLKQGPGFRPLTTLLVLHYFGKPIFWFSVRYERYAQFLLRNIRGR